MNDSHLTNKNNGEEGTGKKDAMKLYRHDHQTLQDARNREGVLRRESTVLLLASLCSKELLEVEVGGVGVQRCCDVWAWRVRM